MGCRISGTAASPGLRKKRDPDTQGACDETGDVGAERDDPEMIDAGEIERKAGKFCCQAMAFEWVRHFGVGKNDTAGKAAIRG